MATAQAGLPLEPGVSYFTEEFDATLIPWRPAPERNVEEVFKNHKYFEIVLGRERRTISVIQHRNGYAPERRDYTLLPSGALAPVAGDPAAGHR
jgi:hypothetical protein